VKNFNPDDYIGASEKPRRLSRGTQLAFAATQFALRDSRIDLLRLSNTENGPLPIVLGVGTSAMDVLQTGFDSLRDRGPASIDRLQSDRVHLKPPQASSAEGSVWQRRHRQYRQLVSRALIPSRRPPRQFEMANQKWRSRAGQMLQSPRSQSQVLPPRDLVRAGIETQSEQVDRLIGNEILA
jgi:3-oxoacyl-(acyl-carrier-protein) synthase